MKAKYTHLERVIYIGENEINVLAEANHFCSRNMGNIEVENIVTRPTKASQQDINFVEWECYIYFVKTKMEAGLRW
jgi:hypothetical protein